MDGIERLHAATLASAGLAALGLALASTLAPRPAAAGNCTLRQMAALPVTMSDMRPLISAKINDTDVRFMLDSGAFYSMLTAASAAELKLKTHSAPFGFYVTGIGGSTAEASVANVAVFTLAGVPLHNIEFLVGGSTVGADNVGILGQNVLHIGDVEYDLGQGVVRLFRTKDCQGSLAYWANNTATPFSVVSISATTPREPHTVATATINGREIRVLFDSGAGLSTLSLRAAARVGITPASPGVTFAGEGYGVGTKMLPSYIAPFASFKLGDEEIRNTRLRIADLELPQADMLLGPDFFLSHRIYVATSQRKLYFSYNGGPVFNLSTRKPAATDAAVDGAAAAAAPGPEVAADFSRRGVAAASRRDFAAALAALTRACELAPDNAQYLLQRARVHAELQQAQEARSDVDQALKLQPDLVPALLTRAEWSLQSGDKAGAGRDLDAATASASPQAEVRLAIAQAYLAADLPDPALAQLNLWVAAHADDARLPTALETRCRIRALAGSELPLAVQDCDIAVKKAAKGTAFQGRAAETRGLLRLRLGDPDRAIADFTVALKIDPKSPWSLYGLGLAKLRKHDAAGGRSDMDQAASLRPGIAETFGRHGLNP